MLEILLCHLKHIVGVCEENVSSLFVLCHILVFAFLESIELFFIIAFNPTCFIEAYWFPAAFGIVFILEAVLYNLKLKLSNSADNLSPVELIDKQWQSSTRAIWIALAAYYLLNGYMIWDILRKKDVK